MRLRDRVVLVAGGAGSFGSAIAERALREGARPVLLDRDADGAARVAQRLGERAHAVVLDVTDPEAWPPVVERVEQEVGPVTGLVNTAGTTSIHRLEELDPVELRELTASNHFSVVYAMQAVFPAMRRAGGGSIVSITSISARFGVGYNAAYAAAHGAVQALSRTAAIEWAPHGIRVSTVVPGTVDTPMARGAGGGAYAGLANLDERVRAQVPLQRAGTIDEVAAAVAYLLADESGFSTGTDLVLDGGQTAGRLRTLAP